jgi:hypothetical protein
MITCPHCAAPNADGAAFCASCGKALPVQGTTPRVIEAQSGLASSHVGQSLQAEELRKLTRRAFTALIVVAVMQFLGAGLFLVVAQTAPKAKVSQPKLMMVAGIMSAIGVGFIILAIWARKNPLPAAITGFVILVTLWVMDMIADPMTLLQGIILKIVIVAMLIRAIQAGLQYRKLDAVQPNL